MRPDLHIVNGRVQQKPLTKEQKRCLQDVSKDRGILWLQITEGLALFAGGKAREIVSAYMRAYPELRE